jgi:hypothetical protein
MFKRIPVFQIRLVALLLALLLTGCVRARMGVVPSLPPVQDVEPVSTEDTDSFVSPTVEIETLTPLPVERSTTPTSLPNVTVTAIKGNLFIRRGPDLAYNPTGILYKDNSAKAIARDVLSDWIQIIIPGSENTGWVSLQTRYSRVDGDIATLPDFTPTDWPLAAYLRNCTHHEMYILPGETILPSSLSSPENETWLYPGIYTVYDLDAPHEPEVMTVDIREGSEVEIRIDGLGEKRKCP